MFAANKLSPETGRLLVAEPFLSNGHFRRSVILLAEHGETGTVGFMLNKPLDIQVADIIPEFPEFDEFALSGGPVQRDQLYYIHTVGEKIEGSIEIGSGLWWQGNFEHVKELISLKQISRDEIRFFVGYAGWEAGQLQDELEEKSWFVARADKELIFMRDADAMWQEAVRRMGKRFAPMANFPENPSMN
ncbi:MAG TPA: YqgE/AlgH family protein [Bacteroidia bacterium]|nr:YqgE/AlgH family protein [Bacteroidia bacterium]